MIRGTMVIILLILNSFTVSDGVGPVVIEKVELKAVSRPTEALVLKALRKEGVKHPRIVLAQSKLETGRYRSKVCLLHKNLFGFRTKKGYIKFRRWQESVTYYKKWQDRHYNHKEYHNYYEFLEDVGYAEDSLYITKVKSIANERS